MPNNLRSSQRLGSTSRISTAPWPKAVGSLAREMAQELLRGMEGAGVLRLAGCKMQMGKNLQHLLDNSLEKCAFHKCCGLSAVFSLLKDVVGIA